MIIVEILYLCGMKTSNSSIPMRLKKHFLAILLLIMTSGFAQNHPTRTVYQNGKVPVWLDFGVGLNLSNSCDWGVSPQTYFGLGANAKVGVTVEWNRCHAQADMRILGNMLFNQSSVTSQAYGGDFRGEFLYRGLDFGDNRWHLWYGGGAQAYFDLKLRSHLMNAAFGYTSFVNLFGSCKVQYDFRPAYDGKHYKYSVYGKLSLPLLGWATRPDFSYIGNATSNPSDVLTILKYHETFAMAFPGASTDFGILLNLPNSNKIGLSYCWDYLTTRHNGAYRFDHAVHTFNITYLFNVN